MAACPRPARLLVHMSEVILYSGMIRAVCVHDTYVVSSVVCVIYTVHDTYVVSSVVCVYCS